MNTECEAMKKKPTRTRSAQYCSACRWWRQDGRNKNIGHCHDAVTRTRVVVPFAINLDVSMIYSWGGKNCPCYEPNTQISGGTSSTSNKNIKFSALFGVHCFRGKTKPTEGDNVIWIWNRSGQITAGDYYKGAARDASINYLKCKVRPTHWMPWPENWPGSVRRIKWIYKGSEFSGKLIKIVPTLLFVIFMAINTYATNRTANVGRFLPDSTQNLVTVSQLATATNTANIDATNYAQNSKFNVSVDWINHIARTNRYGQYLFVNATIEQIRNQGDMTNLINRLIQSGDICRVVGHKWDKIYSSRRCVICGKVIQVQDESTWKVPKKLK